MPREHLGGVVDGCARQDHIPKACKPGLKVFARPWRGTMTDKRHLHRCAVLRVWDMSGFALDISKREGDANVVSLREACRC